MGPVEPKLIKHSRSNINPRKRGTRHKGQLCHNGLFNNICMSYHLYFLYVVINHYSTITENTTIALSKTAAYKNKKELSEWIRTYYSTHVRQCDTWCYFETLNDRHISGCEVYKGHDVSNTIIVSQHKRSFISFVFSICWYIP